jgi:hypothetical protein
MCKCTEKDTGGSNRSLTEVKVPEWLVGRKESAFYVFRATILVDSCIAEEIGGLLKTGIITVNSCCGHNKGRGTIIVADESVLDMEQLGYEHCREIPYENWETIFYTKTV